MTCLWKIWRVALSLALPASHGMYVSMWIKDDVSRRVDPVPLKRVVEGILPKRFFDEPSMKCETPQAPENDVKKILKNY